MLWRLRFRFHLRPFIAVSLLTFTIPLFAAGQGTIKGQVFDPQGAVVRNAKVTLQRGDSAVSSVRTGADGGFLLSDLDAGWYEVRVEATGFVQGNASRVFLPHAGSAKINVTLQVGPLRQEIVVSATGTAMPTSQVGASVSVIHRDEIQALNAPDLSESLRLIPGAEVVQTGQRGGTTSLFVRGGNADFNKVLIDGIPVNDIGGAFEFADLSAAGVDRVEMLRGPNSVLYGADALGSVVNITSRRGTSLLPELTYAADGGNFGTYRQVGSLGGAFRQFDYFSEFSRFDTRNSVPNNSFHNASFSGNYGWQLRPATTLRTTVRNVATAAGVPNAIDLFGIPDDAFQKNHDTYVGVTADTQTTGKWHNLIRYGYTHIGVAYDNPSPTGQPFDPFGFGPNYLGNLVTIRGANGYSVTGKAILDFGGDYPQPFNASTERHSVYAQSDYNFRPELSATFGFRYENENGFTASAGSKSPTDRNNFGYLAQVGGSLRHRAYATVGIGFDHNAIFGFAASPRASLAYYLRQPTTGKFFNDTKLKFNFGKGIKEPSIFDEGSSLFKLLSQAPQSALLISQFAVSPIGPERSRSFDFGLEQRMFAHRAQVSVTFFHDSFSNLIEFVNKDALAQLGVPFAVVAATPFGAAVNSAAYRTKGLETEAEASLGHGLRVRGAYTYLDPVITRSFSSSAHEPALNPAFPGIPIGAFSPLVGNHPFRRASHSGNLLLDYSQQRFGLALAGYFVGRSDDSTFLSDPFFGNSMLLPNRNLLAGYQKIDVSGWFAVNRVTSLYTGIENALSEHYQASTGYPALPLTFRAGVRLTVGGEQWKKK